jgi:WD40 repeat protein
VLADGRVATGSEDGTVKLWNPATGDVLTHVADASPTCVACPSGLPSVGFGCVDGSVSLLGVEPEATDLRRKA